MRQMSPCIFISRPQRCLSLPAACRATPQQAGLRLGRMGVGMDRGVGVGIPGCWRGAGALQCSANSLSKLRPWCRHVCSSRPICSRACACGRALTELGDGHGQPLLHLVQHHVLSRELRCRHHRAHAQAGHELDAGSLTQAGQREAGKAMALEPLQRSDPDEASVHVIARCQVPACLPDPCMHAYRCSVRHACVHHVRVCMSAPRGGAACARAPKDAQSCCCMTHAWMNGVE